ncbi:MAG: hypothetical protein RLZZ536_1207 [Planctomycetota bacterium]
MNLAELNFPKETQWGQQTITLPAARIQTGGTAGLESGVASQPLLVRAAGVQGSLSGFVVELVQIVPGDGDDLRAILGLLDLLLELAGQVSVFEPRFPLLLGELERVSVAGLPGPLEAEDNRPRVVSRQVVGQTLLQFLPGLSRGRGLVFVVWHVWLPSFLVDSLIRPDVV